MDDKIQGILKKFEQDHEVYVSADDSKFYWVVTARVPKKQEDIHRTHRGMMFVSGQNQEGNVLIFRDPDFPEIYTLESWAGMGSFRDFVDKSLDRILADKEQEDMGLAEGCGTQCA